MTLGILGSMVLDTIEHPDAPLVQRWGGISYSLAAAAAALPHGWTLRPILKVGDDLVDDARAFLATLPGLDPVTGFATTTRPNNRVRLRYVDRHHRHEFLTGGVPPWTWDELVPRLDGVDALFVNLISGFELDLGTAARLRAAVPGLLYVDLHSLLLDVADGGLRRPRALPDADRWVSAFDVVQVNEPELALVAGADAPLDFARRAVTAGLRAFLVTRGPEGALVIERGDGKVRETALPLETTWPGSDPTGCGDVWGATCFIRLVDGDELPAAARAANRAAARNVAHRGADGLYQHLKEVA